MLGGASTGAVLAPSRTEPDPKPGCCCKDKHRTWRIARDKYNRPGWESCYCTDCGKLVGHRPKQLTRRVPTAQTAAEREAQHQKKQKRPSKRQRLRDELWRLKHQDFVDVDADTDTAHADTNTDHANS